MDKIVIYDTETTNSTIWGSIIEVGAVVVDKNLKEIGKLNIRGRMPEGEVPCSFFFFWFLWTATLSCP